MTRGPTAKQRMFADALFGRAHGNQTEAARAARYKGDDAQLAVQGSRNMKNENVKRLLKEKYEAMLEASLQTYAEALSAKEKKAFLTKDGIVVYSDPQPHWKIQMEAARRVLEYCQSSADETSSKVDGEPKNEDTELLDAPLPAAAAEANLYAEMSETDRQFTRSWLEKGLAAQRLQEQIREQQSQPATEEDADS